MSEPIAPSASSAVPFQRVRDIIFNNWREALHRSRLNPGIQPDVLGHAHVATTQIHTHVMNRPGLGLRGPLEGTRED